MSKTKCVGDRCVECNEDTSFGSGRFVNRIPADRELDEDSPFKHLIKEGCWMVCYDCLTQEEKNILYKEKV